MHRCQSVSVLIFGTRAMWLAQILLMVLVVRVIFAARGSWSLGFAWRCSPWRGLRVQFRTQHCGTGNRDHAFVVLGRILRSPNRQACFSDDRSRPSIGFDPKHLPLAKLGRRLGLCTG